MLHRHYFKTIFLPLINRLNYFLYTSKELGHTLMLILLLMAHKEVRMIKIFLWYGNWSPEESQFEWEQWFKISFYTASSLSYRKLPFLQGMNATFRLVVFTDIIFFSSERTCFYYNWLVCHSEIFFSCHPLKYSEIMLCSNNMIF